MTCFLHISAFASCVASTSHVEIAPVSSSSSPSSPGKLSCQSKHDIIYIISLICLEHRKKKFVMSTGKCLGSHSFTKHCQLCILYKIGYFSLQYQYVTYNLNHFRIYTMFYCNLHSNDVQLCHHHQQTQLVIHLTFITMIHISCTVCMLNLIVSNNIYYYDDICS